MKSGRATNYEVQVGSRSAPLRVTPTTLAGHFQGPTATPIDLATEVRRQLAAPLSAPPLTQAVVPGDHVCVVLDPNTPQAADVVAALLEALDAADIDRELSRILLPTDPTPELREALAALPQPLPIAVHDPNDGEQLAYLANSRDGRRIVLSREATDADVILPVGVVQVDPVTGFSAGAALIYPTLGNFEQQRRAKLFAMEEHRAPTERRHKSTCDDIASRLGVYYALTLMTDRLGQPAQVWFGEAGAVQRAAVDQLRNHWSARPSAEPAELVAATLAPRSTPASWDALARALTTARRLADPKCTLLLLTDLSDPPSPALQMLANVENPWSEVAQLREYDADEAWPAVRIAMAVSNHPIYLLSQLPAGATESLNMTAVASVAEAQRLIDRAASVFILEDADRAHVGPW